MSIGLSGIVAFGAGLILLVMLGLASTLVILYISDYRRVMQVADREDE